VRDEPDQIAATVSAWIADLDAIVINGGTGISLRDSTFEAVEGLLDKKLEGFGELFRMLSYHEIGSAAFLSRATAGVCRGKILVSIPGSPSACRLAMEKLLIPELGHIGELLKL
jgi:molybdenum cofactor biosynthesis protein B